MNKTTLSPYLSIITLNESGLNSPIKRYTVDLAKHLSLERHLVHQRVVGLIPSQVVGLGCTFDLQSGHLCGATNRCFSH